MTERSTLQIHMELLSDTIFGSGMSVPGGEDIAVIQDDKGLPYLSGSTLKGLLRESVENWLCWSGEAQETGNALFGEPGWNGISNDRRIQLTPLTLDVVPEDPQECYSTRCFTSLENGMVKEGTLRQAVCIRAGQCFSGTLCCAASDLELIQKALGCIHWAGSMRSRGFGNIKFHSELLTAKEKVSTSVSGSCIHYRLHTELPLIITNAAKSQGNQYETQQYILGSAIRGLIISDLSQNCPEWFMENKEALLRNVYFLDAVPAKGKGAALPSIKGFYEDKEERCLKSVVTDGDFTPGFKRAKLGSFCAIDGDTVCYWSTKTGGVTRIQRKTEAGKDSQPFQVRYISADQDFEGYILLENPNLAERLCQAFSQNIWLGADRFAGFGKCSVQLLDDAAEPLWRQQYGYAPGDTADQVLYLLAVSPVTMLNNLGEPCGLNTEVLARELGIEKVELSYCSTSVGEYGGYNRTWQCREPMINMYDRGSLFRILCSEVPETNRLLALQKKGLGIRRNEGYGEILFLRKNLYEGIRRKEAAAAQENNTELSHTAELRQAKYRWIADHSRSILKGGLSKSQLGTIQSFCQKAILLRGDTAELKRYLGNTENRGPAIAGKYKTIRKLLEEVLEKPLPETLGIDCQDGVIRRLQLIVELIDHSRKGGMK